MPGYFRNLWDAMLGRSPTETTGPESDIPNRYQRERAYYKNDKVYEELGRAIREGTETQDGTSSLKALRNPAHRVVEFYVAHIAPGDLPKALPLAGDNATRLEPVVEKVWRWSNWARKKQRSVRWFARDGLMFLQAVKPKDRDRVSINLVDAATVTDYKEDEDGFITDIRLDVPGTGVDANGKVYANTRTEVWSKSEERMRVWIHRKRGIVAVKDLGTPNETLYLTTEDPGGEAKTIGVDFVPFVVAPFVDEGSKWGTSAFGHAIEEIDELCRMVTRLHSMFFRYDEPMDVVESASYGPDGLPLPPPDFEDRTEQSDDPDIVELGGRKRLRLPSGWTLKTNASQVDYAEGLALVQATIQDQLEPLLPELAYDRLRKQGGELSGRAIKLHLSDAEAKGIEARGNFEAALVRVVQMCLSLAQAHDLEGFGEAEIGTFDSGAFDFSFAEREIIPLPAAELLAVDKARLEVEAMRQQLGQIGAVDTAEGANGDELSRAAAALANRSGGDGANPPATA